jgi:hypothetical protein
MKRLFSLLVVFSLSVSAQTISITFEPDALHGAPPNGGASGFMIDGGLVVTASHVLPSIYPSLKDGYMKANGTPLTLVCYDKVADYAILKPRGEVPSARPLSFHPNVRKGMEYTASYSDKKGISYPVSHSIGVMYEVPLSLQAKGVVLDIAPVNIRDENMKLHSTEWKFIITGADGAKPGFSGGPVLSDGKVIGIVISGENGAWGAISHVDNLKKLLAKPECRP